MIYRHDLKIEQWRVAILKSHAKRPLSYFKYFEALLLKMYKYLYELYSYIIYKSDLMWGYQWWHKPVSNLECREFKQLHNVTLQLKDETVRREEGASAVFIYRLQALAKGNICVSSAVWASFFLFCFLFNHFSFWFELVFYYEDLASTWFYLDLWHLSKWLEMPVKRKCQSILIKLNASVTWALSYCFLMSACERSVTSVK